MEIQEFFEIRALLDAFKPVHVQNMSTVVTWLLRCSIRPENIITFFASYPQLLSLERVGYFSTSKDVSHALYIRDLERKLLPDKKIRAVWRKARLRHAKYGTVRGKG